MYSHEQRLLRLARRLSKDDPRAALEFLENESELVDRLLAAAETLPMPPVPEELSESLVNIMASAKFVANVETFLWAALIHDSRLDRELAGVRGADDGPRDTWTAMYSCSEADVIVDGTPAGADTTAIRGQVLSRSDDAGVLRIANLEGTHEAVINDIGQFELGDLAAGSYDFEVQSDRLRFFLQVDI